MMEVLRVRSCRYACTVMYFMRKTGQIWVEISVRTPDGMVIKISLGTHPYIHMCDFTW